MKTQLLLLLTITVFLWVNASDCKHFYDSPKTSVFNLTKKNFDNHIKRPWNSLVSIVHFYRSDDGESKKFAKDFSAWSNEMHGIFNLYAVDCEAEAELCERQNITFYPRIRIYPGAHLPSFDYEGELIPKAIGAQAARHVHSNVIEISPENIQVFLNENPTMPKVLLFTEKQGIPLIYRALSVAFERRMLFGVVRAQHASILGPKFYASTFPGLVVVRDFERMEPVVYRGDISFRPIFEFLNIFAETFGTGGVRSSESTADKHWLRDAVPELTRRSAGDLCLNTQKTLCVILFVDGLPQERHLEILDKLQKSLLQSQAIRGSSFKFMWMNAGQGRQSWAQLFGVQETPSVVVINPGSTLKYLRHTADISVQDLSSLLESITAGSARFTRITKNNIPEILH
eukprot:TRINITY_DN19968_c0_g1_i1.p1 TRINITY_DN19968_c0_g1~~TRINITY_DN19968_c0_g1_i1.p1  ORF type:complete len:400 (-),score=69.05 TRINITY_DN19968_c0_g1_i1:330-1529(-)